jgi:hypothetical protein
MRGDLDHEVEVEYTQEEKVVFDAFLKIISLLPEMKIQNINIAGGLIDVITGPGFGSWGNKIAIKFTKVKPGITRVELKLLSKPGLESMPPDAAIINRHNIESILVETTKLLKL